MYCPLLIVETAYLPQVKHMHKYCLVDPNLFNKNVPENYSFSLTL